MTIDKDLIGTIITVAAATAAIMSKTASKADLKELAVATKGDLKDLAIATKADLKELAAKIDKLADVHHADALMLQRDIVSLHDRVAKVENRES